MAVSAKLKNIFFAGFCLLAAGSGGLAQTDNRWLSIQSNDLQIVGNAPEPDLRAVGLRLYEFRRLLATVFPGPPSKQKSLRVIVFQDQTAYAPFKPKKADGTTDNGVRGYFAAGDDVDNIALVGGDDLGTLRHEYVHAFFKTYLDRKVPLWLNEGLAEYFETLRATDDHMAVLGSLQNEHLKLLRKTGLQPLDSFFSANERSVNNGGDAAREQFYAQSWLTVHNLFQSGRLTPKNLAEKVSILTVENIAPEKALVEAFGLDYATLDRGLGEYLRQKTLPTLAVLISPTASSLTLPPATPVNDALANAYLGNLLWYIDNGPTAEKYLRKALLLDPNSAAANESLGLILMEKDRTAEAKSYLEKAVSAGTTNYLALFQYAYVLNLESADDKGEISKFTADTTKKMRDALEQSIRYGPNFAESYRLLAFTYFVNGDDLDRAEALVRRAVSLKPDDPEFELLLAQILLRREKYGEAKPYAERLARTTNVLKVRTEAEEVLQAIDEYDRAKTATAMVDVRLSNFVFPQLIFLKRSWLSQADVEQIEKNRAVTNVNRFIIRRLPEEKQVVGRIEKIICRDGDITYNVAADGPLQLTSKGFQDVRMTVLTPGESSYEIGCDAHLEKQLAVINYRQPDGRQAGSKGYVSAISFVPDDFRLITPDELGAMRNVVLEDDTLRRAGGQIVSAGPEADRIDARLRSIERSLRQPEGSEKRVAGRVERIDCSGGSMMFQVSVGEKTMMFSAVGSELKLGWFTVASTQIPLVCGSASLNSKAVLTYRPLPAGVDGELKSLEFVPEEFELK